MGIHARGGCGSGVEAHLLDRRPGSRIISGPALDVLVRGVDLVLELVELSGEMPVAPPLDNQLSSDLVIHLVEGEEALHQPPRGGALGEHHGGVGLDDESGGGQDEQQQSRRAGLEEG